VRADFIAIAAHELRTPMTSLVGYLDLFTERVASRLDPETRRQLQSLARSAHRLRRLVDDMLDMTYLETGSLSLRRAPCLLGEIVLAVIDELRPLVGERRRISAELGDIPPIDGDADKLHQAVSNLVSNALRYSRDGSEIRVVVERAPAQQARLRIRDNGRTIPPEQRDRLFEPFTDLDSTKHHSSAAPDSAGLGLRIARGIIELHGGSIHVDSKDGPEQLTEMTVLLPLAA
jgi:signal transduction histidine kinase